MSSRLPVEIDPENLVEKKSELSGHLPLSGFVRLSEALIVDEGEVDIIVSFRKDGDIKVVSGHVNAALFVQCQCCLKPVCIQVDRDFLLAIVRSNEQAKRLPDIYDPLLLEKERVVFSDLVEDELILAIPDIPRHEDCQPEQLTFGDVAPEQQAEPNPFAKLAKLKSKEN
ncbi:MAG TPA: metal-binding protein [Crenotrichaceae bacterium]|nr:metal-binding protein [Crenotrichaceae bacterium]